MVRSASEDGSLWTMVLSSTRKHSCVGGKAAASGTHDLQWAEDKVGLLEHDLTDKWVPDYSALVPCAVI